jgi:sugar/nucleoside kinase (ribokinase family)
MKEPMSIPSQPSGKNFDITIAGETNLDLILFGLPEAMPLERELLASDFRLTLGGSSSILAHNLAVLGSRVGFQTQIGEDELGSIALDRLQQSGVDLSRVQRVQGCNTGITVVLPHASGRHILTYLGIMASMSARDLDLSYLQSSRHFHLSSLFLQIALQPALPQLFTSLRESGLTVSLDTNDDPSGNWAGVLPDLLDRIDILLPNEGEILRITRKSTLEDALDALASRVPLIVVKCGSRGAVVQQNHERTWIPAVPVTPVDTIGAGDSFDAGFLHACLRGATPEEATALGNVTGALSTLRPGGTEAFRDTELCQSFLQEHASHLLRIGS